MTIVMRAGPETVDTLFCARRGFRNTVCVGCNALAWQADGGLVFDASFVARRIPRVANRTDLRKRSGRGGASLAYFTLSQNDEAARVGHYDIT